MRQPTTIHCEFCDKPVLAILLNYHREKVCPIATQPADPDKPKQVSGTRSRGRVWVVNESNHAVGYTTRPLLMSRCSCCGRRFQESALWKNKRICITCNDKERAFDGLPPAKWACN